MKRLFTLLAVLSVLLFALFASQSKATTTAILLPQSDGNYKQLTPLSGSAHYAMVNETRCNGLTNYNSTGTISLSARDSYGISVTSIGMGDGAIISQIDLISCGSLNSGTGSATSNMFYRWNGVDSADQGPHSVSGTTPVSLTPTTTISGLSLFKAATSTLEIGAVMTTTGTKGFRLSRIATRLTYSLTVPTAPSALVATNISSTENDLTWADNSNNEIRFRIYRALNGGPYSQVATTTWWNVTSYNDTGLTADQTYSYEVVAYNSAGTSTSNISTAITYSAVPTAPSNLTAVTSSNNVVLTWADNSANENGFKIERSTDNITYTQIATTVTNCSSTTSLPDTKPQLHRRLVF